jgi:putative flippase GtrA
MTAEPEKPAQNARHAAVNTVWRAASAVVDAGIKIMPAPVRRRLETDAGKRFTRFLPVAVAALASSQITLAVLTGFNMTAGKAALCASVVGAGVSYLLSRWAWERKGRPDLLRETVPFWLLSFAVWGVLSVTTHYAGSWAKAHDLHHLQKHLVVQGTYLAANCLTFVTRFLIIHHVIFANRRRRPEVTVDIPPELAPQAVPNGQDASAQLGLRTDSTPVAHGQPKP